MHIFKFNLKLSMLKNLAYFTHQFFTNLAKTNAKASLAYGLNYFKTLPETHKY